MRSCNCLCGLLTLAWASPALAQTIQLPSFNVFSVDTTVLVPDSGPAPVAGNRRTSSSTNSFGGFPRQRATASDRQVTGAHVIAKIHETQEVDEALPQSSAVVKAPTTPTTRTTTARTMATAEVVADSKLASVDELRRQRDAQAMTEQQAARLVFERGRLAQAARKPDVATVYYRSAAKRATGALRQEILAAWRSMNAAATAASPEPISDRDDAGR
jgi:hypothetical protein